MIDDGLYSSAACYFLAGRQVIPAIGYPKGILPQVRFIPVKKGTRLPLGSVT